MISTPGFSADSGVSHERTGLPSMCTVQAPHSAMPQPYLVPVRFRLVAQDPQQRRVAGNVRAMSTRSLLTKKVGMDAPRKGVAAAARDVTTLPMRGAADAPAQTRARSTRRV